MTDLPPAVRAAAAPPSALLAARALGCRRGRRMLFRGVDLALAPGRITWLRGTNGSGKTSLLRILAGLSFAAEGEVIRAGAPLYIGHQNGLKDDLTLAEALQFHAALADLDDCAGRSTRALEQLALTPWCDAMVRTLSQGQRRRGALARLALDETPRAWVLDEPFDALDAQSVERLSALIVGHAARGGAVLLTSHQPVALAGATEFDLEPRRVRER